MFSRHERTPRNEIQAHLSTETIIMMVMNRQKVQVVSTLRYFKKSGNIIAVVCAQVRIFKVVEDFVVASVPRELRSIH